MVSLFRNQPVAAAASPEARHSPVARNPVAQVVQVNPAVDNPVAQAAPANPVAQAVQGSPVAQAAQGSPVVQAAQDSPVVQAVQGSPVVQAAQGSPAAPAPISPARAVQSPSTTKGIKAAKIHLPRLTQAAAHLSSNVFT